MVRDRPPYGHAPTYQISLTYLERQNSYGPDKLRCEEAEEKIKLKQYVSLRLKLYVCCIFFGHQLLCVHSVLNCRLIADWSV